MIVRKLLTILVNASLALTIKESRKDLITTVIKHICLNDRRGKFARSLYEVFKTFTRCS